MPDVRFASLKHTFGLVLLLSLLPALTLAQSSLSDVLGIPQDAAVYPIPGVGFVNLNNGNLHVELPIQLSKDRNNTSRTASIIYDNSFWQGIQVTGPNGTPVTVWTGGLYPGQAAGVFTAGPTTSTNPSYYGQVNYTGSGQYNCGGNSEIPYFSGWYYVDGHGTTHPFPAAATTEQSGGTGCPDIPTVEAAATDGSGYWLKVTNYRNAVVYDMHGNIVTSGGADTNGNIVPGGAVDKLGRSAGLPGFVFTYKTIYVWTNFNFGGVTEYGPLSANVLSSVTLPDGRSYTFQYDDAGPPAGPNGQFAASQKGHYGSLTGISLPTGGQIGITSEITPPSSAIYPASYVVKQISTPDGTWGFNYSGTSWLITATAPPDTNTGLASQTTCSCASGGPQTVSTYAGTATGTPLRTITTLYSAPGLPSKVTTTVDGISSYITYAYADACTPRVSKKQEYDFSGSLLRETDVSYLTSATDNTNLCVQDNNQPSWSTVYLQGNHHITDIPQSVTLYGATGQSGSPIAETTYTYDSTTLSTKSGTANNPVLGLAVHDDTDFGASMTVRGNPTVISQMTSPGTFITTRTNYYNVLGEIVQSVDGNGNSTYFDWTDSWNNSSCISSAVFAYPTTITNAVGQISKTSYNSCDGSIASVKNQNDINANRAGTVYTYDGSQRITNVAYPDTGNTTTDYGGSSVPEVITTTTLATPDPSIVKTETLDGLGRVVQSALTTDPCGADYVVTTYDSLSRVHSVSNPYRTVTPVAPCLSSASSNGITTFTYDALGRKTLMSNPDSTSKQFCYEGLATTGQTNCHGHAAGVVGQWTDWADENGNDWQGTYDSRGRLTYVVEPTGTTTTYTYDALDNLTGVNQVGNPANDETPRVRNFIYDGLSRLTTANNSENGVVGYIYDFNGNVKNRTDARGRVTYYNYDALNRVTGKTYSDSTPPVTYNYDETSVSWGPGGLANTAGLLSSASIGGSTVYSRYSYSYDQMGRILYKGFLNPNATGNGVVSGFGSGGYIYDLAGNVSQDDVGPGIYISEARDGSGHVTGATSNKITTYPNGSIKSYTVLSNGTYSPFGTPSSRLLASGLTENRTYDNRERMTSNTQSQTGSTVGYSVAVSYFPNGNSQSSNDSVNGSWTYGYDVLNRLTSASSTAGLSLGWTYDSFGNRKTQSASGTGSAVQNTFTFNASSTNRADPTTGISYDAAGNITIDTLGQQYSYDAEGHLSAVSGGPGGNTIYEYDSEGQLIYESGSNGVEVFQRNAFGQPTWIYNPTTNGPPYLTIGVYIDGEQIASWQTNNARFFVAGKDWLGTKRFETYGREGSSASIITPQTPLTYTSFPYGDGLSAIGSDPTHFTGKERDTESGLDYFGARYYGSSMGRFMSPDPSGLVFASLANPQSLNLYAYAQNNPLIYTDPTGLDCAYLNNSGTAIEDGGLDQQSNSTECGQNGGYWVDGSMTNAQINANAGTVQLTGTNNGTDVTSASYQDTNVYVDSWLNMSLNRYGHITLGLTGQQQVGQNPSSDLNFLTSAAVFGPKNTVVPGSIQNESTSNGTPGQLRSFALIPVTGMQAQMIQNSINQSTAAPPNYSLNPALGLDCATWAQQVLKDAGIQTGPMQPYPNNLMNQLSNQYTVLPGHQ